VAADNDGQLPLLVKLLDAADVLSVQVHPEDGDPELTPGESGKPEAWIVLQADPGAGLLLGFKDGVDRQAVERCLAQNGPLDSLMNFVPVAPGDAFAIKAGTPHGIGRGVTLLEPQRVRPGERGITYRYWDYNRRYDAHGVLAPDGEPRTLHVARSLAVTDWQALRGEAFVASCRCAAEPLLTGELSRTRLIDWRHFFVEQWRGSGDATVAGGPSLTALTCLAGRVEIETAAGSLMLARGQSGVIPAASGAWRLTAADDAQLFCVQPR
jgi:mannose-6-phosphate isomerase